MVPSFSLPVLRRTVLTTTRKIGSASYFINFQLSRQETPATFKMTDYKGTPLELECINTIRAVSADQVQSANSGHPGAPMGCAPIAYLLWGEIMNYSSSSPDWMSRDRFVLSNGHACALQYTMLHLAGYETSTLDDLKKFRQLGSRTPGHPECFVTKGTLGLGHACCLQSYAGGWHFVFYVSVCLSVSLSVSLVTFRCS